MNKILIALLVSQSSVGLTYTKDIKPIFKNRCSSCHDHMPGKNWQKYHDAFLYKILIKDSMILKTMPPGKDMLQEERDQITKWVNRGAKE